MNDKPDQIEYPDTPLSVALVNSDLPIQARLWALDAIVERRSLRARLSEAERRLLGKEQYDTETRKRWNSDPLCKLLDATRARIAGMMPGDAVVIADATDRIVTSETQLKHAMEERDRAIAILHGVIMSLDVIDQTVPEIVRGVVHGAFMGTEQDLRAFLARLGT